MRVPDFSPRKWGPFDDDARCADPRAAPVRKGKRSVSQHDNQPEPDAGSGPENVTRQQGGQFSMESESYQGAHDDALDQALESGETMSFVDAGLGSINAMQVSMDRSGAEYIRAQRAFLTSSGAKTIEGESSKLSQSGVLQLTTQKAELHQSSSVVVIADEAQIESSPIMVGMMDKATLGDGTRTGMLMAGEVEATGDVRSFVMVAGDVSAGGSVQTTVDMQSAAVFGAVFGAVFALIWRMIRRG